MSGHEGVMMHMRDRRHEMSPKSYEYCMSRRGCGAYEMESERRGKSRSGSGRVVDERGEYGRELSRGGLCGRVRSRSPMRYHEGARRGDVVDIELGHRRRNTPPLLKSREKYEPASEMVSPSFKGFRKYGKPTTEAGWDEYIALDRNSMVVSENISVVRKSVEGKRMVRPYHGVQPVLSYDETSSHFLYGSTNRVVDKRVQYGNHLTSERTLILGDYNEEGDNPMLCSRDTLYPVFSKSQVNTYASTSPAYRDGHLGSSCCQGVQHMNSVGLHGKRSKVSEKSVFDAYEGHPPHYSTLDHPNNARGSTNHLKSTHDRIHFLNYHYPTGRKGEICELGYLSDGEYRDVHAGSLQTRSQRASGISEEVIGFLSDEEYGDIRQHARNDCYNACLPLSITNETEDEYIPDYSLRDFHLPQRVPHHRDIHPDSRSCFSHPENHLHGGIAYDHKDPLFITPSNYDHVCMASGTSVDNYHNHGDDSVYNNEETHDGVSESRFRRYSVQNKQDGEHYYMTKTVSSSGPRDKYVDCRIPEISREIKQYGQYFNFPQPEREQHEGRVRYNDLQRERINTKFGSVCDVNITSEYDMAVGRLDTNKQRWVEEDSNFRGAPDGVLETDLIAFKNTKMLNSGRGTSHRTCNTSSSRYLLNRNEILSEEGMIIQPSETIGSDCTRRSGSRSIFDRLGSPRGSINQFTPRLIKGHFVSHKHELGQIKGRTKFNHRSLNGSPHLNRGSSCYKQSKSSNTNIDEGHMKHSEDTNSLADVDLPVNSSDNCNGDLKQSVQKAFLLISLKMNENPATRRRYKGQGKTGTLFCIVCKRSNSKEFGDAQGLAAHSLTCQKSGLRAQHLGLFKAICVTMGWNSDIDQETGRWTPQVLPEDKALAQKEDLICWPPVFIVHDVSLLRKNHSAPKVLTTEELETFFRSKGFITGRVKVCLGQSTNSRNMAVKFLGTFPGLKDAENLHKYYAENKRGRTEFWKLVSSNAKGSQSCETVSPNDNAEMPDLYGYMGIAEEWDNLDTDSKKRCTIKSKQEILDFSAEPILHGAS